MKHLLIGAVSGNYKPSDIQRWVETSKWDDCQRTLMVYNTAPDSELLSYLSANNVAVVRPKTDFWGNERTTFYHNTADCSPETSYALIHNIRFFHIWEHLCYNHYDKVLVTDVKDVYFNRDPFADIPSDKLIASSEEIIYSNHAWNSDHLHHNLGVIGLSHLLDDAVHNVGVFGGSHRLVMRICADIYLMSVGKPKVADQTSFNYLIQTIYRKFTQFTTLKDFFAVHLHVINEGKVPFDYNERNRYAIIHQWDRISNWDSL